MLFYRNEADKISTVWKTVNIILIRLPVVYYNLKKHEFDNNALMVLLKEIQFEVPSWLIKHFS